MVQKCVLTQMLHLHCSVHCSPHSTVPLLPLTRPSSRSLCRINSNLSTRLLKIFQIYLAENISVPPGHAALEDPAPPPAPPGEPGVLRPETVQVALRVLGPGPVPGVVEHEVEPVGLPPDLAALENDFCFCVSPVKSYLSFCPA